LQEVRRFARSARCKFARGRGLQGGRRSAAFLLLITSVL
jgi:hypothetical protein